MSGEDKQQEQQQGGDPGLPAESSEDSGGQEDGDPGGSGVPGLGHGVKVQLEEEGTICSCYRNCGCHCKKAASLGVCLPECREFQGREECCPCSQVGNSLSASSYLHQKIH